MPGLKNVDGRGHSRREALLGAAMTAGFLVAGSAGARPKGLNTSLDRLTDLGTYRVSIKSLTTPIPMSRVHQWAVHLTGAAGHPVSGAVLAIDGGMPEHGHGLPTKPRATALDTPGDYLISGMKFSMTGWWELKLTITGPDGRTDRITFNVIL